jgi:putative transcriptional regulator
MIPWLLPPPPRDLDVAAIRRATGHCQASFAGLLGVSVGTLRGWEIGRRMPTGSARALLVIVAHDPAAYATAIAAWNAAST